MHNNQNSRGYGYSQQPSSSSRSSDRINDRYESWHKEPEWSARDESWRGNSRPDPPPDRGRNDSWKMAHASPSTLDFRLGRDRAPMPVDDQFLVRYGAKRLNNGNLVDRDGYTLRVRDPDCQAPSPPTFNPGREMRRNGDERSQAGCIRLGGGGPPPLPPPSQNRSGGTWERLLDDDDDMVKFQKARQQIRMMEKMEEESKRAAEERRIAKLKKKEQERRKEKDGEDEWEEPEGQDEYEDVIEEPPEKKEVKTIPPCGRNKPSMLPQPRPFKTNGPPPFLNVKNGQVNQRDKPIPREGSWYSQYTKNVEALKEKLYKPPAVPPPSSHSPAYYPRTNEHYPPSSSHSAPSGASPAVHRTSPFSTSSPYSAPSSSSAYPIPCRQMNLPPPGVVEFDPMYSTRSRRYSGVDHGREPPSASTPSAYSLAVNAFGVFVGNQNAPRPSSSTAPSHFTSSSSSSTNRRRSPSTDSGSGSEDEAIRKLREIIRNHGSRH